MMSLLSKLTAKDERASWGEVNEIDAPQILPIGYCVQTLEGLQKRVNMYRQAWEHSLW